MSSRSGTISGWMPRPSPRLASVIAVLASVGLMWASPAAADPPTRTEFTVPLSGPHFLTGFCGTQIEQDGGAHIASTDYGDGRLIEHVRVDLVLTANGDIAYEEATFTVVVDPRAGTVTQTGTLVNIHAPPQGLGARGGAGGVVSGDVRPPLAVGALDDPGRRMRRSVRTSRQDPELTIPSGSGVETRPRLGMYGVGRAPGKR